MVLHMRTCSELVYLQRLAAATSLRAAFLRKLGTAGAGAWGGDISRL